MSCLCVSLLSILQLYSYNPSKDCLRPPYYLYKSESQLEMNPKLKNQGDVSIVIQKSSQVVRCANLSSKQVGQRDTDNHEKKKCD